MLQQRCGADAAMTSRLTLTVRRPERRWVRPGPTGAAHAVLGDQTRWTGPVFRWRGSGPPPSYDQPRLGRRAAGGDFEDGRRDVALRFGHVTFLFHQIHNALQR